MSRKEKEPEVKAFTSKHFFDLASGSHRRPLELFGIFVTMAACALTQGAREPEYLKAIEGLPKETVQGLCHAFGDLVVDMDRNPYRDLMGPIYMDIGAKSSRDAGGEFFTPDDVCFLMAKLTFSPDRIPVDRPMTVMEPACGAGGMILGLARVLREHEIPSTCMRATCVDVNRMSCQMCFINCTLWGIPATVVHGNSLSLETWDTWRNFLWWKAHGRVLGTEALTKASEAIALLNQEAPPPVATDPEPFTFDNLGQGGFDFDFGHVEDRKSA